jgi:GTPase
LQVDRQDGSTMKFVDQAKIYVRSGNGGAGCMSFRREKYVPRGGPDGGDGGNGGHVILEASLTKDTLLRFHMNQHFRAENGRPGMGKNKHGASGENMVIRVPLGTTVFDESSGGMLYDLTLPGQRVIVAEGGRGGRGNARFVTPTNRAPRHTQPGEPGLELRLRLELKLLADVGLLGKPNVGKSTLISRLSAARPKIADYPFTTLIPCLGVVAVDADQSYVLADIPGLIEGAGQGAGLGHRFLKHVERCRILLHLLSASDVDPEFPLKNYERINTELEVFDPVLIQKKQLVVVNKLDMPDAGEALACVRRALPEQDVMGISALTGEGLPELKYKLYDMLRHMNEEEQG